MLFWLPWRFSFPWLFFQKIEQEVDRAPLVDLPAERYHVAVTQGAGVLRAHSRVVHEGAVHRRRPRQQWRWRWWLLFLSAVVPLLGFTRLLVRPLLFRRRLLLLLLRCGWFRRRAIPEQEAPPIALPRPITFVDTGDGNIEWYASKRAPPGAANYRFVSTKDFK